MKILRASAGFTIAEALVVLIITMPVVFSGYTLWRTHHRHQARAKPSAAVMPAAQPSSTSVPYLTISEWGVRFAVPSDFKDGLSYFVFDPENTPDVIRIISQKYANVAHCDKASGGFLGLHMEEISTTMQQNPPPFKQIDGRAYYFTGTACEQGASFSGDIAAKHAKLKQAIESSLESIN